MFIRNTCNHNMKKKEVYSNFSPVIKIQTEVDYIKHEILNLHSG